MNNDLDEAQQEHLEVVCHACGLGKMDRNGERSQPIRDFEAEHAGHGQIEVVPEVRFRSDYLKRGYEDIDRPGLEPIVTSFAPTSAREAVTQAPFGKPDSESALQAAKRSARALMHGRAGTPLPQILPGTEIVEGGKVIAHVTRVHGDTLTTAPGPSPSPIAIAMRPSWDQTFLDIAFVLARRGTCARRKVGAVIVNGTRIVSDGYNGAPAGLRHCDHAEDQDIQDGHCIVAEHAERNALLYAGRDARAGTLYVTCTPCLACTRMMVTAGIARIVYADDYRADRLVDELCAAAGITLERLSGSVV